MQYIEAPCLICNNESRIRFFDADPLAHLLIRRLRINTPRMFVLAESVQLFTAGFLALLLLITGAKSHQVFSNVLGWGGPHRFWSSLFFTFVLTPSVWMSYVWIHLAGERMFRELIHRGTIKDSNEALHELIGAGGRIRRIFSSRLWLLASVLISTLVAVLFLSGFTGPLAVKQDKWTWFVVFVNLPAWWVGWYMVCQIAVRQVCSISGLRVLFTRRRLVVHPLHPDRCGGLGPLNEYALGFAYVLAIFALSIAILSLINLGTQGILLDPVGYFLIAAYLIGAPLTFFGSVGLAHGPMKQARDELLARISNRFMSDYEALQSRLDTRSDDLRGLREKVDELKKLHDLTVAFPVWPFDTKNVRRFLGALGAPLVPIGISAASEMFRIWLAK